MVTLAYASSGKGNFRGKLDSQLSFVTLQAFLRIGSLLGLSPGEFDTVQTIKVWLDKKRLRE